MSTPATPTDHADRGAPVPLAPEARAKILARHPRPLGGDTARRDPASRLSLTGMVLNNADHGVQQLSLRRKPDWIRARVPGGEGYDRLKRIVATHRLHTVCEEASCPNMGECWSRGTATIMILGDTCTRSCGFCNVKTGKPQPPDPEEPRRVAESLALMKLGHVVITCVDRDDLPDGGAAIWAETVEQCHALCPDMSVEALIGDMKGSERDLDTIIRTQPEILAHNMETVRRRRATSARSTC
jgi:lipoic acid synthetase